MKKIHTRRPFLTAPQRRDSLFLRANFTHTHNYALMAVPIGGDDTDPTIWYILLSHQNASNTASQLTTKISTKTIYPLQLFSEGFSNDRIGNYFLIHDMFLSLCVFLSPRAAALRRKPKDINSHLTPSSWEFSLHIFWYRQASYPWMV